MAHCGPPRPRGQRHALRPDQQLLRRAAHLRQHHRARSSSFVITIKASLRVINRRGKVIYQNSSYTFRQQYEETQNLASFIQEDSPAEERLARDFASAAVSDILDSF